MGRSTGRPTRTAAALATLLALLCSTADAFVADTKIAFVSWRDGDSEIFTMGSDGTSIEQLTVNSEISDELWPAWSPDGTQIAFASTRDGGDFDIYIMDAAGQTVTRLTTDSGTDWEPAWSPDGTRIAFTSYRTGWGELYVMNAATQVELAGYEFRVSTKSAAFTLDHAVSGDVFGEGAFWMDPRVSSDGVHMAAVRLDLADSEPDPSTTGVLARLFVRVDDVDTLADSLRLTDIRLSDRAGELFGYRFGQPTIIRPTYATSLLPNYPNPFNPETWIPFTLASDSAVTIRIFGPGGSTVRTLDLGLIERGDHRRRGAAAYWDGRNELGERVASGVYFYELEAGDYREMRRLVIMK